MACPATASRLWRPHSPDGGMQNPRDKAAKSLGSRTDILWFFLGFVSPPLHWLDVRSRRTQPCGIFLRGNRAFVFAKRSVLVFPVSILSKFVLGVPVGRRRFSRVILGLPTPQSRVGETRILPEIPVLGACGTACLVQRRERLRKLQRLLGTSNRGDGFR